MPAKHRLFSAEQDGKRRVPFHVGVELLHQRVNVPAVVRVEPAHERVHVLLRHRPRSISRWSKAFLAGAVAQ
jgi:hypothetical protein